MTNKRIEPASDAQRPDRVLLVEDDQSLNQLLSEELREAGFTVRPAASVEEGLVLIGKEVPDVIVSDLKLPGAGGMDLLHASRSMMPRPAFILVTAFGTIPQAVEALKAGADDFITKPINLDHFVFSVRRSAEVRRLRNQVKFFETLIGQDHFHGILGRSDAMRTLFDHIRRIARGSGAVLLMGESGTGKELVARALHEESSRAGGPFLAVNCAGVPHELLESEFFGHEKGAFTGAAEVRPGIFAEASGGTVLLDEIAEMTGALQAKLLRVLQEGAVKPIGSNREVKVDVRIVAATNRDLASEVENGAFRSDLYYRLETFTLNVPPLRSRQGDRRLLTRYFLGRFNRSQGKRILDLTSEAWAVIDAYPFPGNVRELENAIERATTYCDGERIQPEHLPLRIREASASGDSRNRTENGIAGQLFEAGDRIPPPLAEMERRYMRYVLNQVGGNKRRAAAILGIGRKTLYRRLGGFPEELAE